MEGVPPPKDYLSSLKVLLDLIVGLLELSFPIIFFGLWAILVDLLREGITFSFSKNKSVS
jgi:hypothetical protein